MDAYYKILSLDGGGSWAILQVLTLKEIFQRKIPGKEVRGHEVLRHFDLVIANSGGSLVLAALACNWTFNEILGLFENEEVRNKIFHKLTFWDRYFPANFMRLLGVKTVGTRYSTTNKGKALKEILKINNEDNLHDISLSDLPGIIGKESLEIVVPTFDIVTKRAKLFRSNKASNARAEIVSGIDYFDKVSLVEAIHGSSNAPVNYFDFPAIFSPDGTYKRFYLWDGALGGFNNPVMAGLTEALSNNVDRERICILSLGTGSKVVSDSDANMFRDQYYSTLLGKSIIKTPDNRIDFRATTQKKGLFFRLFRGAGFYASTISNLSQSILFEPQTWASFSAYTSLFSGSQNDAKSKKRFVRLSPHIVKENDRNELVNKLYQMDMDVTSQKDVGQLISCFQEWKNGNIRNEPIHWTKNLNGYYVFALGHKRFEDAIKDLDWL